MLQHTKLGLHLLHKNGNREPKRLTPYESEKRGNESGAPNTTLQNEQWLVIFEWDLGTREREP